MNELVDIIEPVAPIAASSANVPWIVPVIVAVAALVILAVGWHAATPRARALRRMRRLRREVARGGIGARELAYRVAAELQGGLRTPRLRTDAPPSEDAAQQKAWRELIARLDTLRYQPGARLDATQLERLLRDSARWLRVH